MTRRSLFAAVAALFVGRKIAPALPAPSEVDWLALADHLDEDRRYLFGQIPEKILRSIPDGFIPLDQNGFYLPVGGRYTRLKLVSTAGLIVLDRCDCTQAKMPQCPRCKGLGKIYGPA